MKDRTQLSDDEIIAGFQQLIDSGLAWQLQGFYGRTAQSLIESGKCHPAPKQENVP